MTRPRLVHVTTTDMSLDWLLGPQLEAFAAAGYEVIGASAAGPHVVAVEARGVRHVALRHATRAMDPVQDLAAFAELVRLFRDLRPDIVHTHNPKPGVYGRLAAGAARVPVIVNTVHGLYALPTDSLPRRAVVYGLEWLASRVSAAELVQSVEDLPVLESLGVPATHLYLLGNGIDLERFDPARVEGDGRRAVRAALGVGDDDVLIGAVGRLVVEKGYVELIEAFGAVSARWPEAKFVVVGPEDTDKADALSPELLSRADDAGVRFLGHRDDMVDLYAAMDVYVLASHREGFPRSAMEAAAMGLPVVATDIRGCRQVVEDGLTGMLVPVGDAHALATAISSLVSDSGRRGAMGRAARDKATLDFDQQRLIDQTLAVYGRLLDQVSCTPSGE